MGWQVIGQGDRQHLGRLGGNDLGPVDHAGSHQLDHGDQAGGDAESADHHPAQGPGPVEPILHPAGEAVRIVQGGRFREQSIKSALELEISHASGPPPRPRQSQAVFGACPNHV